MHDHPEDEGRAACVAAVQSAYEEVAAYQAQDQAGYRENQPRGALFWVRRRLAPPCASVSPSRWGCRAPRRARRRRLPPKRAPGAPSCRLQAAPPGLSPSGRLPPASTAGLGPSRCSDSSTLRRWTCRLWRSLPTVNGMKLLAGATLTLCSFQRGGGDPHASDRRPPRPFNRSRAGSRRTLPVAASSAATRRLPCR